MTSLGDDIAEGKGQTIQFSYRGTDYKIDLTDKEATGFDKSIATYLEHAINLGGRRRSGQSASGGSDYNAREVRTWARDAGIEVPDRGRIPADVLEKYRAAN